MTTAERGPRTQEQRRARTRNALLEATIDCLVELGYTHSSVQEICARAGVSKGAVQHHFTDKAQLLAAAADHLIHRIRNRLPPSEYLPDEPRPITTPVDLLWSIYSGIAAGATTELGAAARTDPGLRAALHPIDDILSRSMLEHLTAGSSRLPPERLETLCRLTVSLIRGLALDAELGGDPRKHTHLLDEWKNILVTLCDQEWNHSHRTGP